MRNKLQRVVRPSMKAPIHQSHWQYLVIRNIISPINVVNLLSEVFSFIIWTHFFIRSYTKKLVLV